MRKLKSLWLVSVFVLLVRKHKWGWYRLQGRGRYFEQGRVLAKGIQLREERNEMGI